MSWLHAMMLLCATHPRKGYLLRFSILQAVEAAQKAGKSPDTFYCLELLQETGILTVPGALLFLPISCCHQHESCWVFLHLICGCRVHHACALWPGAVSYRKGSVFCSVAMATVAKCAPRVLQGSVLLHCHSGCNLGKVLS